MKPNMRYNNGPSGRFSDPARIERPQSARHSATRSPNQQIWRSSGEWRQASEISVKLTKLHDSETTWNLWRNFKIHGHILYIEIFEGEGKARIQFSPPPSTEFWGPNRPYRIQALDGSSYNIFVGLDDRSKTPRSSLVRSPIRPNVQYNAKTTLWPASLHIGIMVDQDSMMPLHNIIPTIPADLKFTVDLVRKKLVAEFKVTFEDPRSQGVTSYVSESQVGEYNRKNNYMFEIPFDQLKTISKVDFSTKRWGLAMSLVSPPRYHRKREDEQSCHSEEALTWSDWDTWYRQTDIVYDPYRLQHEIVALHKEKPVIDIGIYSFSLPISWANRSGRWTTYIFVFEKAQSTDTAFNTVKQALQDYNIEVVTRDEIRRLEPHRAELWSLIDTPTSENRAADLQNLDAFDGAVSLPFEVRYQLEVCISREILNEYNTSREFVVRLAEIALKDPTKARNILEYIAEQDKRIYEPMSIFDDVEALAFSPKTEIPHYCAYARKATITPSTIYFSSPTVETTNRVLRRYARENQEGRFLRVQFTDELLEV